MNISTLPSTPSHRGELRRQWLAKRLAWASSPQAEAAQIALQDRLFDVLRQLEPQCLGLFWPIQGEFNPRPVALRAQQAWNCQLALPWAQRDPRQMHYRPWFGEQPTTVDECGIPSPLGRNCTPDVVLVPCVGFTRTGYRLGYGGGYFDRYLAANPDVTAIGVAWALSEVEPDALRPAVHDVALMGVVTEQQTHSA